MIARDKLLHAGLSFAATISLGILATPPIAAAAVWIVGVIKEVVHDGMLKRGVADQMDMVANIAGIALALLLFWSLS